MIKRNLLTLLTGIVILAVPQEARAAAQEAEANVVVTSTSSLGLGIIASTAGVAANVAGIYTLYNIVAATYYSTLRSEPNLEEELYNNKECREHAKTAFKSWLTRLGLSALAGIALLGKLYIEIAP